MLSANFTFASLTLQRFFQVMPAYTEGVCCDCGPMEVFTGNKTLKFYGSCVLIQQVDVWSTE